MVTIKELKKNSPWFFELMGMRSAKYSIRKTRKGRTFILAITPRPKGGETKYVIHMIKGKKLGTVFSLKNKLYNKLSDVKEFIKDK